MSNHRRMPIDTVNYEKLKDENFTNYPLRYTIFSSQASIQRKKPSDPSYEICLVERTENRVDDESNALNNFRTALSLAPPVGYYIQLTPHPLLLRNGYMMDTINLHPADDRDEIVVSLFKINDGADLELPFPGILATLCKVNIAQNLFKCNDVDSSICGDNSVMDVESNDYHHAPKSKKKIASSKKKGGASHFM
jgi:hypothetical protein